MLHQIVDILIHFQYINKGNAISFGNLTVSRIGQSGGLCLQTEQVDCFAGGRVAPSVTMKSNI